MSRSVAGSLRASVPAMAAHWRQLLHGQVRLEATVIGSALADLTAHTLTEYLSALEAGSLARWICQHPPHTRSLCAHGVCSLPNVIVYFAAGEKVVMQTLRTAQAGGVANVMQAHDVWHFLAQREIETHCHDCHRVCSFMPVSPG